MPLKQVTVKTTGTAPAKKGSDVLTITPQHVDVIEYVKAVKQKKEAERVIAELEPDVKKEAVHSLLLRNTQQPTRPITTIRLTQVESVQGGEGVPFSVRVSFKDRYRQPDLAQAEQLFKDLGADINESLQQSVGSKFDASIFISRVGDDQGDFSKRIYDSYRKSMENVTAELIKRGYLPEGTKCPLETYEILVVRDGFHATRWARFPKVDQQERIAEALPNDVTATVE
jgi:hypothetical protein